MGFNEYAQVCLCDLSISQAVRISRSALDTHNTLLFWAMFAVTSVPRIPFCRESLELPNLLGGEPRDKTRSFLVHLLDK